MNDNRTEKMPHSGGYKKVQIVNSSIIRAVLIVAGTTAVGLGVLGIFLPVLPTTPFLLLAAACYAKSSEKFHHWLFNNKWFGSYINNYLNKKGIPLKVKIYTISLLWITILLSAFLAVNVIWVKVVLIVIAVGVTVHILSIRTLKRNI